MSAVPTPYSPSYDFSDFSDASPTIQQPGGQLDAQFDAIAGLTTAMLARAALIQRDDGALLNGVVTLDSLSLPARYGILPPRAWATTTAYIVGDLVVYSTSLYSCLIAHTAGTFATDLAAAKWVLVGVLNSAIMAPVTSVVQSSLQFIVTEETVTATIPYDASTPLISEGTQIFLNSEINSKIALFQPLSQDNTIRVSMALRVRGILLALAQIRVIAALFRSLDDGVSYTCIAVGDISLDNDGASTRSKEGLIFLKSQKRQVPGPNAIIGTVKYQVRVGTPSGSTIIVGGVATNNFAMDFNVSHFLFEEVREE